MPTGFSLILAIFGIALLAGGVAVVFFLFREFFAETQDDNSHEYDPADLFRLRQAQEKDKVRCPDCGGTRCWDVRRNGRPCGNNPTESTTVAEYLVGRHSVHGLQAAVAGWWPLPKTLAARVNPDLWAKVAGHCQVALTRPVGAAVLP